MKIKTTIFILYYYVQLLASTHRKLRAHKKVFHHHRNGGTRKDNISELPNSESYVLDVILNRAVKEIMENMHLDSTAKRKHLLVERNDSSALQRLANNIASMSSKNTSNKKILSENLSNSSTYHDAKVIRPIKSMNLLKENAKNTSTGVTRSSLNHKSLAESSMNDNSKFRGKEPFLDPFIDQDETEEVKNYLDHTLDSGEEKMLDRLIDYKGVKLINRYGSNKPKQGVVLGRNLDANELIDSVADNKYSEVDHMLPNEEYKHKSAGSDVRKHHKKLPPEVEHILPNTEPDQPDQKVVDLEEGHNLNNNYMLPPETKHDYDIGIVKYDKNLDEIKLDEPNIHIVIEVNSFRTRDRAIKDLFDVIHVVSRLQLSSDVFPQNGNSPVDNEASLVDVGVSPANVGNNDIKKLPTEKVNSDQYNNYHPTHPTHPTQNALQQNTLQTTQVQPPQPAVHTLLVNIPDVLSDVNSLNGKIREAEAIPPHFSGKIQEPYAQNTKPHETGFVTIAHETMVSNPSEESIPMKDIYASAPGTYIIQHGADMYKVEKIRHSSKQKTSETNVDDLPRQNQMHNPNSNADIKPDDIISHDSSHDTMISHDTSQDETTADLKSKQNQTYIVQDGPKSYKVEQIETRLLSKQNDESEQKDVLTNNNDVFKNGNSSTYEIKHNNKIFRVTTLTKEHVKDVTSQNNESKGTVVKDTKNTVPYNATWHDKKRDKNNDNIDDSAHTFIEKIDTRVAIQSEEDTDTAREKDDIEGNHMGKSFSPQEQIENREIVDDSDVNGGKVNGRDMGGDEVGGNDDYVTYVFQTDSNINKTVNDEALREVIQQEVTP